MKYDCQKLTEIVWAAREFQPLLRAVNPFNLKHVQSEKNRIEREFVEALGFLDPDQIMLRDKTARKCGCTFVEKFNRFGLAIAIVKGDSWMPSNILVNKYGEKVFPRDETECNITGFQEGVAVVTEKENGRLAKRYFLKEDGKRVNDKVYSDAKPYRFGQALVKYSDDPDRNISNRFVWHVIDIDGNELRMIDLNGGKENIDIRWSDSGYLGMHKSNFGAWYITPAGERIPSDPSRYFEDNIGDLNKGIAKVCDRQGVGGQQGRVTNADRQRWYFISQEGKRLSGGVFAKDFRKATNFVRGRAFIQTLEDIILLVDIHGNVIKKIGSALDIGAMTKSISKDGLLTISKWDPREQKKVRIGTAVDLNGQTVVENIENLGVFSEGYAFAEKAGKPCLIDTAGNYTELPLEHRVRDSGSFQNGVIKLDVFTGEKNSQGFDKTETIYFDKKGKRVFSS